MSWKYIVWTKESSERLKLISVLEAYGLNRGTLSIHNQTGQANEFKDKVWEYETNLRLTDAQKAVFRSDYPMRVFNGFKEFEVVGDVLRNPRLPSGGET